MLFFLLQPCKINRQSNIHEMPAAKAKDFFIISDCELKRMDGSVKIVEIDTQKIPNKGDKMTINDPFVGVITKK